MITLLSLLLFVAQDPSGSWAGGYGRIGGDRPRWSMATITDLKPVDAGFEATVRRSGTDTLLRGAIDGDAFTGKHDGVEFRFVRVVPHDVEPAVYELEPGHRVAVDRRGDTQLSFVDFETGVSRALFSSGDGRFTAGPGIAVPLPVRMRFRFAGDQIAIEAGGQTRRGRRISAPRTEAVRFERDDIELAGTVFLPDGDGPHPGVVWVHGSGRATRSRAGTWPLFLTDLGIAVLAFDKQGVGESGGRYGNADGSSDNLRHMRSRAEDVRAAVDAMRARADIDGDEVGLMGGSQAGWVSTLAARSDAIAFAVLLSPGIVPVSLEGRYSRLSSEQGSDRNAPSARELNERVRSFRPVDHDFAPDLERMWGPSLWLFGDRDRSLPAQLSVELLDKVKNEADKDITVVRFADGNHGLLVADAGGAAEVLTLDRLVPGLHVTIAEWLRDQGFARR